MGLRNTRADFTRGLPYMRFRHFVGLSPMDREREKPFPDEMRYVR